MKKPRLTTHLPRASEIELSHWVKRLQEAQAQVQRLLGGQADAVLGAGGETFLLQETQEKLLKSEEEARRIMETQKVILDALDASIALIDTGGTILFVNEAWRRLTEGAAPGEPKFSLGQNYIDLCDRAEGENAEAGHVIARGISSVLCGALPEFGLLHPRYSAAQTRWFRLRVVPLSDTSGAVVVHTDITDLLEAERAAQAGEARYREAAEQLSTALRASRRVMDFSLDVICTADAEGRFIDVSPASEKIWGYQPAELIGTNYIDKVLPDDQERTLQITADIIAGHPAPDFENRFVRKDGTIANIVWSGNWSEADQVMFCVARDMTERKIFEQKLAEQAALIDEARDAIILRDLEHKILFWNRGAERLYGWTAAEAIGRPISEVLYRTSQEINEVMEAFLIRGEWRSELEHVTKSGEMVIVESRWTLLRDGDNQPKSILIINSDITERRRMESHLLRAQRMESIGTLAGGIAHDLNNLLVPIILGVGLLKHLGAEGPSLKVIDDIERSAKRGSSLVKQVLSFARGVEGASVVVHIGDVINEIESIILNTFPKNLTLETTIAQDIWLIDGDPTQLNQVLLNLCVNARDAMPDGGLLSLTAENLVIDAQYATLEPGIASGRYVCVKVADTGCGIPKENLDKIFDPFFTTKELGKGTGLGLSTTLRIIRSHGGFLNIYSEVGKGTIFTIYLPAESGQAKAETEPAENEESPRGSGEWILLVDDEIPILTITAQALEAFGYHILTAEHGATAVGLYAANQDKIALVLTDMMMPVMDGPSTIMALRKINPKVRIVAASGLNVNAHVVKAARAGVKHFLPKPYSTDTMLKTIKTALMEAD